MSERNKSSREMTFWDHFIELSKRFRTIFFSVIIITIIVAALPVGMDFSNLMASQTFVTYILTRLKTDLLPKDAELILSGPLDSIQVYMTISVMLGVIVSMPVIAYELYKFFNPALYPTERKFLYSFIISFVALFAFGVALAYSVIVPVTFLVVWSPVFTGGITLPYISIKEFLSTVFWMCIATGFMFILPVIFVVLVRQGILKTSFLTKRRKFIYAGGFVLAMILTPDPTPITAALIWLPLFTIIEIAVLISKRYEKAREQIK